MNGIYGLVTRLPSLLLNHLSGQTRLNTRPSMDKRLASRLSAPLLLAISIGVIGDPINAESDPRPLSQLQADFFVNALRFVHWTEPAMPDEPIQVVLVGRDAVCDLLRRQLNGLSIRGRPLKLAFAEATHDFHTEPLPVALIEADTIYFGEGSLGALQAVLPKLQHRVLTVSSLPGFVSHGGMLEITQQENRQLAFQINSSLLQSPALSLDSQILRLSRVVDDARGESGEQ